MSMERSGWEGVVEVFFEGKRNRERKRSLWAEIALP
jgi:hypothetical protein